MGEIGITVTATGQFDGATGRCFVALASVDHHRQGYEQIAYLGEYPEPLAWELATFAAREWKVRVIGPRGAVRI